MSHALNADGTNTTTTTTINSYTADTYSSVASHAVSLPLSLTIEPSKAYRFGFGLTPNFSYSSSSYSHAGKTNTTTSVDDGDADPAATDAGDSQNVVASIDAPYTYSDSQMTIGTDLCAGVQIYLKPDTIRLNLGTSANTVFLNRTTNSTNYTGLASSTTTSTVTGVTTTTGATSTVGGNYSSNVFDTAMGTTVAYSAGVTFFITPNITFDLVAQNDYAFNLTSTTDNGGAFNLGNYIFQLVIKLPSTAAVSK
jgi:hypothetical protein